jgi:ketosteroid isomerase-like protein
MIDSGGGMEKNDMTDLKIQVMPGGDVAVATYMLSSVTRNPNGKKQTTRAFETDVWQKIDDNWKIISMHYSEIPPVE